MRERYDSRQGSSVTNHLAAMHMMIDWGDDMSDDFDEAEAENAIAGSVYSAGVDQPALDITIKVSLGTVYFAHVVSYSNRNFVHRCVKSMLSPMVLLLLSSLATRKPGRSRPTLSQLCSQSTRKRGKEKRPRRGRS